MALLSKDQILAAEDTSFEDVAVPEWGGTVRVKALSGAERDQFEQSVMQRKGKRFEVNARNMRAKLVAVSVVDEDGNRLFADADVEALGKKSAAALDRVFTVAQRLSGLTDEDVAELEENFTHALNGSSISA